MRHLFSLKNNIYSLTEKGTTALVREVAAVDEAMLSLTDAGGFLFSFAITKYYFFEFPLLDATHPNLP